MKNQWTVIWALLALSALVRSAGAHQLDQSYLYLNVEDDRLGGRVEMTLRDINTALGLELPEGEAATLADVEPHVDRIRDYINEHVQIVVAGVDTSLPYTDVELLDVSFATFLQVGFAYEDLPETYSEVDVRFDILFDQRPDHRGMLVIESNWKTGTFDNEAIPSLVFEPGRERQVLDLSDSSTLRGFNAMVRLGTHHIWIGIDHILFLIALLLPAVVERRDGRWQPIDSFKASLIHVIKVVTVFTVAHTITLSLAALNAISMSSRVVESIIALSIAIAALNIVVPIFKDRIWLVVFAFGLFHGFGFASVLGEFGIPSSYLVLSLLGFNLGVELGQVAIVLVAFPVLYLTGRSMMYSRYLLPAATSLLVAISMYWFIERAFLIDLPAGAILNRLIALGT